MRIQNIYNLLYVRQLRKVVHRDEKAITVDRMTVRLDNVINPRLWMKAKREADEKSHTGAEYE